MSISWLRNLTFLQWAEAISMLILIVGAIWEYEVKLKPLTRLAWRCISGKASKFERCAFRKLFFHSIAPVLVVLGIAGELIFETASFLVENREAIESSNRVARLGPRGPLLNVAHIGNDKRILRFGGQQQASIVTCDGISADDNGRAERMQVVAMLWTELATQAHWPTVIEHKRCSGLGIWVYLSAKAGRTTKDAANALAEVMREALLSRGFEGPGVSVIDPKREIISEPHNPDTVVVLVNAHFLSQ
jgi:hypothetical protein